MIRFTIDEQLDAKNSLNVIYSGRHWRKRQAGAYYWHLRVRDCLSRQKVPRKALRTPVRILLAYNDGLDIDNHGYVAKLIIDGMKGYLLPDDNRKHVESLVQTFHDGRGIIVEVFEAGEEWPEVWQQLAFLIELDGLHAEREKNHDHR